MKFIKSVLKSYVNFLKNPEIWGAFLTLGSLFTICLMFAIKCSEDNTENSCAQLKRDLYSVLNEDSSTAQFIIKDNECYIEIEYDDVNSRWVDEDGAYEIINKKIDKYTKK